MQIVAAVLGSLFFGLILFMCLRIGFTALRLVILRIDPWGGLALVLTMALVATPCIYALAWMWTQGQQTPVFPWKAGFSSLGGVSRRGDNDVRHRTLRRETAQLQGPPDGIERLIGPQPSLALFCIRPPDGIRRDARIMRTEHVGHLAERSIDG